MPCFVKISASSLAIAFAIVPIAASAQEGGAAPAPSPTLDAEQEEASGAESGFIVVTARKREESLLEVPVAITAFTSEDISKRGIEDIRDVAVRTPGFQYAQAAGVTGGGRTNPNVTFRGMQNLTPVPQDQTASAFLDGMFLTGGPQAVSTIDIERIEVLKGPQSTYFGKATFGGAINFVTKTPGFEFQTEVNAELATYDTYKVAVANEGPLIEDKLAYRVSVSSAHRGPMYRSSTDGGGLGEESTMQGVLTLYATPGPQTSIKLRLSAQEIEDGPPATTFLKSNVYGAGSCDGFTYPAFDRGGNPIQASIDAGTDYFCGAYVPSLGEIGEGVLSANTSLNSPFYTANPNFSEIPALQQQGFSLYSLFVENQLNDPYLAQSPRLDHIGLLRRDYRGSLQLDHEFDSGISVAANIGYSKARGTKIYDYDNTGVEGGYGVLPLLFEDFFTEARVLSNQSNRFRWLLGVNRYVGTVGYDFTGSTILRGSLADATGNATRWTRSKSLGFFGSVEFDVTDRITAILENRYQIDEEIVLTNGQSSGKFKDFAPRAIVKFSPTDDLNLYASYSVGILPGRNNTGFITASEADRQAILAIFGDVQEVAPSDKLKQWELGAKQSLFAGRLNYSLAAYYARWENKKISVNIINPGPPSRLLPNVVIPGEIKIWGAEFELNSRITDKWDVGGTLAYNDTENVVVFNEAEARFGTPNFKGKSEPRQPKWTWSVRSTYTTPVSAEWDLFVFGEGLYKGQFYGDNANLATFSPRFVANARIGVDRGDLRLEAFVTNLFNDKNWVEGQRVTDLSVPPGTGIPRSYGVIVQAPDKRQVGLRASMQF